MDDTRRRQYGMFRFSIIGHLIACDGSDISLEAKYRELAAQTYIDPDGRKVMFCAGTIKKWYLKYKKAELQSSAGQGGGGLQALMPRNRIDLGRSRALTEKQMERIRELKTKHPRITGKGIWETMVEEGSLKAIDASVDTVQRYLKSIGLNEHAGPRKEHLAFEFEHANDCWQCDTTDGPVLTVNGKERETYIISFLDDHSRKILAARAFTNDNAVNMQIVFKEAIRVWGVPRRVMMDNGGPYKNAQLTEICAELGIPAINLLPYSPEGKGKVERYHRDIISMFLDRHSADEWKSLDAFNDAFKDSFLSKHDKSVNRMTGETPHDRFMRDYGLIRHFDKEKLDFIFLHRDHRCLQKDSTIQFNNVRYEVPWEYAVSDDSGNKRLIRFRYDPSCMEELYIVDEEKYEILYTIKAVDLVGNSKRKRKSSVNPASVS